MTKRTKKSAPKPRAKLKDLIAEKARKEKAAKVDTVTASASAKPPALAAMSIMIQLDDIAEAETLLTQRMSWKALMAKARQDPGVQTILEVEQEVGQAIFAHSVKMAKMMMFQAITAAPETSPGQCDKAALYDQVDAIQLSNPYQSKS